MLGADSAAEGLVLEVFEPRDWIEQTMAALALSSQLHLMFVHPSPMIARAQMQSIVPALEVQLLDLVTIGID